MPVISHLKKWENYFPDNAKYIPDESNQPLSLEPKTLSLDMKAGTVEVSLAIPIPKTTEFNPWLMDFINYILGKPPNSIFFKLIREKYALAYDARTLGFHYTDYSLFMVYLGITDALCVEKTISLAEEILTNITSYLNEEKLELYKRAYVEQYWMNSDHLLNFSRSILYYALSNTPLHPEELLRNIQTITLTDIEIFLKNYIKPSKFSKIIIR